MSYKPGTVLGRKELLEGVELAPYNEIRVIGPSPVQRGIREGEWAGQLGDKLTVQPVAEFGPNIDQTIGELQRDYDIVSVPPPQVIQRQEVEVLEAGPSPEEVFTAQAGEDPEPVQRAKVDPDAPTPEETFAAVEAPPAPQPASAPPVQPPKLPAAPPALPDPED